MKQLKYWALAASCLLLANTNTQAQIFTPSGIISGSTTNNNTLIGSGSTTPSNKLIVSDNMPTAGGLMKLDNSNGLASDKWWLGFVHGGLTSDYWDRARIGVEIQSTGAGQLFFTTGNYGISGQVERMRIDENGKIGIGIAPDNNNSVKINATAPNSIPWAFSDVGLEVNCLSPSTSNSTAILAGGGQYGIVCNAENSGGIATVIDANTGICNNGIGINAISLLGTTDNIAVKARGGGQALGANIGYGVHATAQGAQENIGVYGKAVGNTGYPISVGGRFVGDDATNSKAGIFEGRVDVTETSSAASTNIYGISSDVSGNYNDEVKGVKINAVNGVETYGLDIFANGVSGASTNTYGVNSKLQANTGNTFGVKVDATNNSGSSYINYGIRTDASSPLSGSITNYGIYATVSLAGTAGSYAGYFKGATPDPMNPGGFLNAAFFNGGVAFVAPNTTISDQKFKYDVKIVDDAMSKIMQLKPSTYMYYGHNKYPSFNFPTGHQYGFIAQELEEVIPELVVEGVNPAQYDKDGKKIDDAVDFKSVNYTALIPVLTAGIQEQQKIIIAQKDEIESLKERVKKLEGGNTTSMGNNTSISIDAALYQNAPNPFGNITTIGYKLPMAYSSAKMLVFDMNGRQLRNLTLEGNGDGSVTLEAGELAAGMYLYSLVIDGQEINTKRMIINK